MLKASRTYRAAALRDKLRNAAWAEVSRIINDNRLRDKNSAFARLAQKLEIVLLHRLKIPKNEYSAELMPQASMNCSIMKGLSVSDSYSSGKTILLKQGR